MIFLHIGLPKTGTGYLQRHYLAFFKESQFLFNPPELMLMLREILSTTAKVVPEERSTEVKEQIRKYLQAHPNKLVLSNENFSFDGYCPYYQKNVSLLSELFPNSQILVTLRQQKDWCMSMYKQSVQQGNVQTASQFLDFSGAKVTSTQNYCRNLNKALPKLDVYSIDWPGLVGTYQRTFGKCAVHVFFHERFRENPEAEKKRICDILEVKYRPETRIYLRHDQRMLSASSFHQKYKMTKYQASDPRPNRSLSMAAIECSIVYSRVRRWIGLPIKYKMFRRTDSRERRLTLILKVIGSWWFWRELWQRKFDRLYYWDWDVSEKAGWSTSTNDYFLEQNYKLNTVVKPEQLPKEYFTF